MECSCTLLRPCRELHPTVSPINMQHTLKARVGGIEARPTTRRLCNGIRALHVFVLLGLCNSSYITTRHFQQRKIIHFTSTCRTPRRVNVNRWWIPCNHLRRNGGRQILIQVRATFAMHAQATSTAKLLPAAPLAVVPATM
ncbi:hypothetical protein H310_12863 [Aphanomyces invadans]|uniref:Uncharacterized protein n=1 Tax=Aphanomyces invadans TaxID=157072 RepID=A0A024TFW6_9STRA|nr:hypothetical protein H310_12863 [Aphanomyces invadans]ETV93060.1 hypothetical protein H310_12863 [Aphanomyces invadans]|eukprot:XP_008878325.1 hypothetical protein H310_12863 [Aphanomyces invadans]